MDTLDNIKDLWLSANTSKLPSAVEAMAIMKAHRFKQLAKTAAGVMVAVALGVTMVYVVFFYESVLLSTRIGEGCMLAAIAVLLFLNMFSLRNIPMGSNISNQAYLSYARQLQRHQLLFYRKIQLPAFLLACAGLLLYLYEGVSQQPRLMILVYIITAAFILMNWFVLRPRAIRKRTDALQKTIDTLERLSTQLSEN
jgi:hypothetical protein